MKVLFCVIMIVSVASGASYGQDSVASRTNNVLTNCDQGQCQLKANYMASKNIRDHIWNPIGNFEGIGYGKSANCNTCVPNNSNMRLTGDAVARGNNGMWYRVRSWR
jgi:hypothetical protein